MSLYNPFAVFHSILFFYVYGCFACVYICVPCACLAPEEVRREHWLELQMVVKCEGIGPGSFGGGGESLTCIAYASLGLESLLTQPLEC